jgi:hypothetical protein
MSNDSRFDDTEATERGIYLVADTPLTLHALAVEGGDSDTKLLAEAITEQLDADETDELINALIRSRVGEDRRRMVDG